MCVKKVEFGGPIGDGDLGLYEAMGVHYLGRTRQSQAPPYELP